MLIEPKEIILLIELIREFPFCHRTPALPFHGAPLQMNHEVHSVRWTAKRFNAKNLSYIQVQKVDGIKVNDLDPLDAKGDATLNSMLVVA